MKKGLSESEIQACVDEVLSDGFCILKDHFPKEVLARWAQDFQPLLERQIVIEGHETSRGANRYYVTLPFQAPFADPRIFEDDDVIQIVQRLVGHDMVMCQLATDTPILGSDFQEIHRDAPPLFPEMSGETPPFQLALNFPLVDVTRDNGPFEVIRKTHKMTREEGMALLEKGQAEIEPLLMSLGDLMIRDVRGLHRGTPNRTQEPRPMAVIGYSRKWLHRPEVSIQISKSEFAKLSDRAKKMLRFNPITEFVEVASKTESYQTFAY